MMHDFTHQLTSMGLTFDDYMKKVNKDEATLRDESRSEAEKRAKMQLVLTQIAENEKLEADQERLEKEMAHILEHYKEADEERVRIYINSMLLNERVFEFLEKN